MPPSPPWPSWTVGAHCWTWQRHGKPPRLPLPPSPPPAPPVLLAPLIGGINGGPGAPRPTSTTALLPQLGITGCPVAALTAYLTLHRAMPAPASHPLFLNPDGSFTREHVPCDLRAHASHCGLYPAQVSSHGLRIGSAWTMANEGVPIATIQVLGRWKCDLMPLLYCRMSLDRLALATRALRLSTANVHVELYPPLPPPPSVATNHRCVCPHQTSLPPAPPPSHLPLFLRALTGSILPASVTSRCIPPPGTMARGRSPSPGHQLGTRIGLGWAKSRSFHTDQVSLIRCCCCHCCGAPPYPNHGSRQPRVRFTVSYPFLLARTRSFPHERVRTTFHLLTAAVPWYSRSFCLGTVFVRIIKFVSVRDCHGRSHTCKLGHVHFGGPA